MNYTNAFSPPVQRRRKKKLKPEYITGTLYEGLGMFPTPPEEQLKILGVGIDQTAKNLLATCSSNAYHHGEKMCIFKTQYATEVFTYKKLLEETTKKGTLKFFVEGGRHRSLLIGECSAGDILFMTHMVVMDEKALEGDYFFLTSPMGIEKNLLFLLRKGTGHSGKHRAILRMVAKDPTKRLEVKNFIARIRAQR